MLLQDVPQHLSRRGQLNDQLLSCGGQIRPHATAELLVAPTGTSVTVVVAVRFVLAGAQGGLLGGEEVVGGARRAAATAEWSVVGVRAVSGVRSMCGVSGVGGVVSHMSAAVVTFFLLVVRAVALPATRIQLQEK